MAHGTRPGGLKDAARPTQRLASRCPFARGWPWPPKDKRSTKRVHYTKSQNQKSKKRRGEPWLRSLGSYLLYTQPLPVSNIVSPRSLGGEAPAPLHHAPPPLPLRGCTAGLYCRGRYREWAVRPNHPPNRPVLDAQGTEWHAVCCARFGADRDISWETGGCHRKRVAATD